MKNQYTLIGSRLRTILLVVLSIPLFSFQYSSPYNIKIEDELIRFIANNHDHSSLNFTNIDIGSVYVLEYNRLPKMPEVILGNSNVTIINSRPNFIEFIAQKNNTFHFNWNSNQQLKEFSVNVYPREKVFEEKVVSKSQAVITTNSSVPVVDLVDSLISGDCFQIFNVTGNGGSNGVGAGTFANGSTSIGISSGIVLSNGNISNVIGPNNSCLQSGVLGSGSDPDLTQIAGVTVNDASIIEFDFIPTVDTVQFKFVWASEEYCNYSGSAYTDVCGFFVSGDGINGAYSNNSQNFAKSPFDPPNSSGGNINVNLFSHYNHSPSYYISNNISSCNNGGNCQGPPVHPLGTAPGVNEFELNAHSAVFDAIIPVTPCSTYHIKIAVGDGTDGIGDSAFFLQGNSWNQGNPVTVEAINSTDNSNQGFETCGTYYYEFCKDPSSNINEEVTMDFVVSPNSTATPGLDYNALPTSVVIPAGTQCVQVPITTLEDDLIEGQESIILDVEDACNCSSSEVVFLIDDVVPLESTIPDEEICGSGTISLSANPTGGIQPYQYNWSTGGTAQIETVNSSDSPIFVTITDDCGEQFVDDVIITELSVPDATISGSGSLCPGSGASVDLFVSFSDSGPWEFTYLTDGGNPTTITTSSNPYTITITSPGSYTLQSVINTASLCPGNVNGIALITTGDLTVTSSENDPLCFNSSEGSITLSASGGSGNYSYSWSHDGSITGNSATGLPAGTYTIDVSDGSSSCVGNITVVLDNPAEVNSSVSTPPLIDCNNPTATVTATPTGGTGSYFYTWTTSNGNIVSGSNSNTITIDQGGDYNVSIEDTNGCTTTNSVTVADDLDVPTVIINTPGVIDCINTTTTLDGSPSDAGTILWTTSDGNIVSGATTINPVVDQAGTYTLTITDLNNGCSGSADVVVTSNGNFPTINITTPGQIDCNNNTVTINAGGSSSGAGIDILWTTSDGNIVSGATTLTPVVDQGGSYNLSITDTSNGCTSTDVVVVIQDTNAPSVDVGSVNQIDCNNPSITLGGPGSSSGPNISYAWVATSTGTTISTSSTVTVTSTDTYELTVSDSNNGCVASQTIVVTEDTNAPTAVASGGGVIDCNNSTLTVSGAGSTTGMSYSWSASNGGNILSGGTTLTATVNAGGTYTLTVTNPSNGCSSVSTGVIVTEDLVDPVADAGMDMVITCASPNIILNGTNSSPGLTYLWTTSTGNIVSGETTLQPEVNQAGTYILTVTDPDNGCSQSSNVDVTSDANLPVVDITPPNDITCTNSSILLDATGSSGGTDYLWTTTNGNIVSGANSATPTVDAAGTYTLTFTDAGTGCSTTEDVIVIANDDLPTISISSPADITCVTTSVTLDGSSSSGGTDYLWTTTNGNIVSGANTATPVVNGAGIYTLTYSNTTTGCINSADVEVFEDTALPTAIATSDGDIDCNTTEVSLNGGGSDTPPNFDIIWTTSDGNILFGETTLTPVVDSEGTYTLTVTSLSNGCISTADVTVAQDLTPPVVDAGSDANLTCDVTEVTLDGTNSEQGPGFTYLWTTTNGNIVSGENSLTPLVDAEGTYTLSITSDVNGCTGSADVTVNQDADVPVADAGPTSTIDCNNTTVTLDGSMSTAGLIYQWSTTDGSIVSGATTLNPVVDAEGTYILLVTNTSNGCDASSSVFVSEFTNQPVAVINTPGIISCNNATITLDASASSSGTSITYLWTTSNGNIVSGADTPNPVVDLAGTYTLLVTDNSSLCDATADVTVTGNSDAPIAVATASGDWDCASDLIELNAIGSDNGFPYALTWSTPDGNITSQTTGLIAEADTSGTYILTVLNVDNNCTSTVTLTVLNLVNYPSITINDPGPINCSNPEVDITTTITNEGTNPTFSWTTTDGNIVSGASTSTATVDAAGTYEITVTNSFNSCSSTESIDITENSVYPTAVAGPTGEITCSLPEYTLDGAGTSTGTNYTYQWTTTDGNIVSGGTSLTPIVDAAGSYILSVTDTSSLCESLDTVSVTSNLTLPNVEAGPSQELNCTATEVTLAGSTTNTGPDYTYLWSTANGNIVSGENTLTPLVDASGLYILSITDQINGCIGTDSVDVTVDANTPNADAGPGMVIDCSVSSVTLDGSGSSSGTDFTYLWTTTDGNIVSDETTTTPTVDAGGTYTIEVTSTVNGCAFTSNVTVTTDTIVPDAMAGFTGIIDCNTPTLTLSGTGSSTGTDYTYLWTTTDGTIDSGANTLDPVVSMGGTYTLSVVDTTNTCAESMSIVVPEDTATPVSVAGDTLEITCTNPSVILLGDNSDTGPSLVYQWTTSSGNIVSGGTTLNPEVDGGGVYILNVSNSVNGCFSEDSTLVTVDANLPIADAGAGLVLDCVNPIAQLDGNASSSGATIEYLWTTTNGNIVSDETTTTPTVDAGGTYSLQVTDTSNGCVINSSVDVTDNTQLPIATASATGIVDCNTPTITISGAGSSTGTEYTYQWTTANGTIDSGDTTLDPVVSQGGTYTLTIIDTTSSCEQFTDIVIAENTIAPLSEAGDSSIITCVLPQVVLDGSASDTGTDFTYLWTTSAGNIVTDPTSSIIEVDAAGVYTLTVLNNVNGCIAEDSTLVELDANVPTADAGSDLTLDCDNPTQQLDGASSSSGATIEYLWTTQNGNIVSGETTTTPTVDAGGTYSLQVTDSSNGCVISSDVIVVDDTDIPVATANFTGIVDCTTPTVAISGTGSSTGTEYTYEWTTSNGTIDSGANTLDPVVSQGGVYDLLIIDTLSNCQSSTSVTIPEDSTLPTVDVGPDSALDCATPTMTVDGSNSSSGTEFTYLWTTLNGNINGPVDGTSIAIDSGGVYVLTVSNTVNGCVDSASVNVSQDFTLPQVTTDPGGEINCTVLTIPLTGQVSGNIANFTYDWQFFGGGSVSSGQGTLNAEATQADMYFLVVTDTINNCTALDSVEVTIDANVPSISIADIDTLDCSITSLVIDASASTQDTDVIFNWVVINGQFDSGTNTLTPTVSTAGTYELVLNDTVSNCLTTSQFNVEQDTLTPGITFSSTALIDCFNPSIPIDATISSSGNVDAVWTAGAGGVIDGTNTGLSINVSTASTYDLQITDLANGCLNTETIVVSDDLDNPILAAVVPDSISCPAPNVTLSATADTGGDPYSLTWTTTASGSLDSDVTTLTPTVSGAAPYTLTVQNSVNGCVDSLTVDVFGDLDLPAVVAQVTDSLDCNILLVDIDGAGSSSSGTFDYTWSTSNGNIVSGQSSLLVQVDQPGDYTLLVQDLSNACEDSVTVAVTQNIIDPSISLSSSSIVNCYSPIISIDATVTSNGAFNSQWTATSGGTIEGVDTDLTVDVSSAGTYEILVTDSSNGCTSLESLTVTEDKNNPILAAAQPDSISCPQPIVSLSATIDTGGEPYTFSWSTNTAGNINSGANTLNPSVSVAAPYTLTAQNNTNGCIDSLVVDVFGNLDLPAVNAQVADFLSCSNTAVDIDGAGSASSGAYNYTWSTDLGNIIQGQGTLLIQVDQPGDYSLVIEDLNNSCIDSVTVTVDQNIVAPVTAIALPDTLTCGVTSVDLFGDAGPNPAPTYLYTWSTMNGNITSSIDAIDASTDQTGTYTLQILDSSNGCLSESSVDVIQDITLPDADAGTAQILDCNLTAQTLDGSLSSQGANYTYLWSTINGNIVNQANTINPEIDAPGTYEILVTNIDNQCTNVAQITVDQQIVAPMVEAGQSDTINCIQSIAQLSGLGSSTGTDFEYLWSSFDGNPISNQTQLDASVDIEGVYQLLVTDNSNGCSDSDIVIIAIDTITPTLSGQVPDILNCSVTEAILSINSSVINDVSYDWTTSSGNIISGSNTANPIVDAPGIYELQFVNLVNGCEAQEQITVQQDINQPTIDAGSGGTITCVDLVFTAQATSSTNSGQSNISWTTPNGTIDSGAGTLNPIFSDQGLYIVEIIDPINDCIDVDTVEVFLNQNYPVISPLSPLTLDCNNVVVTIDGSSTNLEPQYQLQWTTAGGNIVSGGTTLSPVVDLAGQYDLTIVDVDNGCVSSESVLISSDFEYPDISAGTDIDLPCGVSVTSLQGTINGSTADLQILWNALNGNIVNGGSTLTPTIDIGGTYALSVVNTVNGCESMDTVSVMFDAPPVLNYTSTDPLCAGDFGSLNIITVTGGTPPFVYSIDDGDNYSSSADFGFLPAGEYNVVAQDFNGCETDISVVTITEPPVFDVMVLDSVITYQEGEQAQIIADPSYPLSSITSILWSPPTGLSCVDCLDPVVSTQTSTTYVLELINANGCEATVAIPVFVDKSANVFIANTFTPNSDGVNEVLMIMADVTNIKEVKRFEVYDRWGEQMFSRSNFPPNDPQYGWDGTFNGSVMNQGVFVYYVEVEMLDGRIELFKGDVFLSN